MANTILTHQMVAQEAAAMFEEQLPFLKGINRTREKDIGRDVNGYSEGASVKVKIPPASKVFKGAIFAEGGSAPDQKETYETLTVDQREHVALMFTAAERALNMTEFKERILRPAISTLASSVHANMLSMAYRLVPASVGTYGTMPASSKVWSDARAELQRMLTPDEPRMAIWSSDAQSSLIDASKVLFNPSKLLSESYIKGSCGEFMGFEFFESQAVPYHTNGDQTLTGITVNGASQTGSTLNVTGVTSGKKITAGTLFTVASVYAVHPLLGTAYGAKSREFTVTEDVTFTATTGTLKIYPPLNTTAPDIPFISAAPADGAALTFRGSASTSYRQNLVFQRDAFAAAFVPLPVIASCEGYTFNTDSMALRVETFGNGLNDTEGTRIDVLYGLTKVRGYHACRVPE